MRYEELKNVSSCRVRSGIVLLVTLVLLVVLSTLGYTLSSRIAAQRHRAQYIVDYQAARYGCDSAVKYALATLQSISPRLINRPNEPDFSDLFYLSEEEYQELLAEAARTTADGDGSFNGVNGFSDINSITDINFIRDINGINSVNDVNGIGITDFNDANSVVIRGPYGPAWPFVTKPAEFEIGSARVRIEIEDENAKYPVGWMLLGNKEVEREVLAGFETFCEWMDVNTAQVDSLKEELKQISEIKPFTVEFKPTVRRKPVSVRTKSGPGRRLPKNAPRQTRPITVSVSKQIAEQAVDVAKLFHSSLIDTEALARPTIISESRKESALKYMGMWGSIKVNVNTAPRQVLETAFTFGGDAEKIAEEIIQRRRIKPFRDIADLSESLLRYSDSIRKCENYITMRSNFFTIRVTVVSGVAEASAVIAITKDGKVTNKIAVVSG